MKSKEDISHGIIGKAASTAAAAPRAYASVVRLAAASLSAPVALIGLTKRGWTTSAFGAGEIPTADILHICSYILAQGALAELNDLSRIDDIDTEALTFEGQRLHSLLGTPIRDEEGTTAGVLCVLDTQTREYDERERNLLNEIGLLAGSLATTNQRGKEDVAGGDKGRENATIQPSFLIKLVQEIRNPLTEVVGFSKLVSKEVVGESRRRAQVIHSQSTRVADTLRSVLDLVQVESGSLSIEPQVLELAGQVREVMEAFRPQIRERGLWLKFNSPESTVEVEVDRAVLRRVIGIVLSNAVKFTEEGGIAVTVSQAGSEGIVEITDTGVGITSTFLPHMYEIFSRERVTNDDESGGTGLGLAIAKRLIEVSGGRIHGKSGQGGSTFTLSFPSAGQADGGDKETRDIEVSARRQEVSTRPVVLLVEDNAVSRRVMERILRDEFNVIAAADVDTAFARAREYDLDILLLDIALNERRTGVEVLHGIRRMPRYAHIPAVVCTAYSLPGLRDRYLNTGFNGYISKPFRKEQLLEMLQNVLETGGETVTSGRVHESVRIELPPLPATLPGILSLISGEDEKLSADDLADILQHDPVVSAWVLRHVNSAYHSVRGTVSSVDRAVTILGAEQVAKLVVAGLMTTTFSAANSEAARQVYDHLLRSSLSTAAYSDVLARHLQLKNPEIAFTAGLLSDVGRLTLLSHKPEVYGRLWMEDGVLAPPTIGKELLQLGIDHIAVGVDVSKAWDLPAELRSVIKHIEEPEAAPPEFRSLALVVAASKAAAEIQLTKYGPGEKEADDANRAILKPLRNLQKLHETTAEELLAIIKDSADSVEEFAAAVERD